MGPSIYTSSTMFSSSKYRKDDNNNLFENVLSSKDSWIILDYSQFCTEIYEPNGDCNSIFSPPILLTYIKGPLYILDEFESYSEFSLIIFYSSL